MVIHRINECDERKNTNYMNNLLKRANIVSDHTVFVSQWLKKIHSNNDIGLDSSSVILSGADNTIFNNIGKIRWNKREKLKIVTHHWGNDWNKGFKIYSELDELINEQKNFEFTYIGNLPENFKFKNSNYLKPLSGLDLSEELKNKLKLDKTAVLLINTQNKNGIAEQRKLFVDLINSNIKNPVIIGRTYKNLSDEQLQISSSIDFGSLLLDGLGDGIFINAINSSSDQIINQLSFGILQATRTRISKTEYISCPSCGRTLFDLQETTAKIRKRTDHLKGIKIGIMGCIVNGPGEMADADYGYVGTGPGLISLYKGQEVVKKNIQASDAVDALIQLIDSNGDWVEPIND